MVKPEIRKDRSKSGPTPKENKWDKAEFAYKQAARMGIDEIDIPKFVVEKRAGKTDEEAFKNIGKSL